MDRNPRDSKKGMIGALGIPMDSKKGTIGTLGIPGDSKLLSHGGHEVFLTRHRGKCHLGVSNTLQADSNRCDLPQRTLGTPRDPKSGSLR